MLYTPRPGRSSIVSHTVFFPLTVLSPFLGAALNLYTYLFFLFAKSLFCGILLMSP